MKLIYRCMKAQENMWQRKRETLPGRGWKNILKEVGAALILEEQVGWKTHGESKSWKTLNARQSHVEPMKEGK